MKNISDYIGNYVQIAKANYMHIFSDDIQKQVEITRVFVKVFKAKIMLITKL